VLMGGLSVAFSKPVKVLSGNDPSPLAIHIEEYGLTIACTYESGSTAILRQIYFPNKINFDDLARDSVRIQKELDVVVGQLGLEGRDVILCPQLDGLVLRTVQTFYMSEKELQIESAEPDFWIEHVPELAEIETPLIEYKILSSDEADDTTTLLVSVVSKEVITGLINLISEAGLNPIIVDSEPLSLINNVASRMTRSELRDSTAVVYLSQSGGRVVGITHNHISSTNFDLNELDSVLLDQLHSVENIETEFWAEVGERLGNAISSACLFLVQEERFAPFTRILVASSFGAGDKFAKLVANFVDAGKVEPMPELADGMIQEGTSIGYESSQALITQGALLRVLDRDLYPTSINLFCDISLSPYTNKVRTSRRLRAVSRALSYFSISILLIATIGLSVFVLPGYLSDSSRLKEAERNIEMKRSLDTQINMFNSLVQQNINKSTAIKSLNKPNPEQGILAGLQEVDSLGIFISRYEFSPGKAVFLKGGATTVEALNGFMARISEEKLLSNVRFKSSENDVSGQLEFEVRGEKPLGNTK